MSDSSPVQAIMKNEPIFLNQTFLMKIMTDEAFLLNDNIIRTQRKTQGQFIVLYILPRC